MSDIVPSPRPSKPNIFWDKEKEILLLRIIHQKNAHIKIQRWQDVVQTFFETENRYESILSDKVNAKRRLKNKFSTLKAEYAKMMETVDASAIGAPELSEKFRLVKLLIDQINKHKRKKSKMKALEQQNENMALGGDNLNGSDSNISISSDSDSNESNFDEPKIGKRKEFSCPSMMSTSKRSKIEAIIDNHLSNLMRMRLTEPPDIEREIGMDMQMLYSGFTVADIISEANLPDTPETHELLTTISVEVLISLYCAPGLNFQSSSVRSEWEGLGLNKLICAKLYVLLEKWRQRIIQDKMDVQNKGVSVVPEMCLASSNVNSEASSLTP